MGEEFGVEEDGGNRFHVADLAGADAALDFGESEDARGDAFVGFLLGDARFQALGEKDHHVFFEEAGGGEEIEDGAHAAGGVARFFEEFAVSAVEEVFAIVFAAGDEFPEELFSGVAVLANHEDTSVWENGEDND